MYIVCEWSGVGHKFFSTTGGIVNDFAYGDDMIVALKWCWWWSDGEVTAEEVKSFLRWSEVVLRWNKIVFEMKWGSEVVLRWNEIVFEMKWGSEVFLIWNEIVFEMKWRSEVVLRWSEVVLRWSEGNDEFWILLKQRKQKYDVDETKKKKYVRRNNN